MSSDKGNGEQPKKGSLMEKLLVPLVVGVGIALLAGGTSPWWFDKLFPDPTTTTSIEVDETTTSQPVAADPLAAAEAVTLEWITALNTCDFDKVVPLSIFPFFRGSESFGADAFQSLLSCDEPLPTTRLRSFFVSELTSDQKEDPIYSAVNELAGDIAVIAYYDEGGNEEAVLLYLTLVSDVYRVLGAGSE